MSLIESNYTKDNLPKVGDIVILTTKPKLLPKEGTDKEIKRIKDKALSIIGRTGVITRLDKRDNTFVYFTMSNKVQLGTFCDRLHKISL